MIRPATKIALEVVAGLSAVALLLAAAAAWRLSQGPLPVSFLTPFVEQAANDQLPDNRIDIEDMVIAWADGQGALELQAVNVVILGEEDQEVVSVPKLAIDFNLRAALAGRLVPKKLVFEGASLTLVRSAEGTISFGLTRNGAALPAPEPAVSEEGDALLATLIEAVASPGDDADAGRHLEGLSIRDAAITVFDQRSGGLWLASDVGLEFRNTPIGMAGVINAHVLSPGGDWDFIGTVRASGPDEPVVIVANLNNIMLPDFARTMVALEPLAMINSAVSGRVTAKLNRDGLSIADLEVDLNAGPGQLVLPINEPEPFYPPKPLGYDGKPQPEDIPPPYTPRPWSYEIDSAHIKGRVTWPEGVVELDELAVKGEAIDLSVAGRGEITVGDAGGIEDVYLSVETPPVAINIPNVTVGIARVDGLEATLKYALGDGRLDIENASMALGEGYVSVAGQLSGLTEGPLSVLLDGEIEQLLVSDLMQMWPPRVGTGARDWVVSNITGGYLDQGVLKIDAPDGALDATPLPDDAVSLNVQFADLQVRYLGDLSPIRHARGSLDLKGNAFEAKMVGGEIAPPSGGLIQVTDGSFRTEDFHIRGNDAFIDVKAAGSMTAILSLIDQEPLGYISRFGLDPNEVSGTGTTQIKVTLPMRSLLLFEDVGFGASGRATQLDMPDISEGVTLNGGDMAFTVSNTHLRANGTMVLAGTPISLKWVEDFNAGKRPGSTFDVTGIFDDATRTQLGVGIVRNIQGSLPVQAVLKGRGPDIATAEFEADLGPVTVVEPLIAWRKDSGVPATLAGNYTQADDGSITLSGMSMSGQGVQLQGSAFFDPNGTMQHASVSRLLLANGTDLSGVAVRSPEDGIVRIDVNGPAFDARDFLDDLFADAPASEGDEVSDEVILANANVDRVTAHVGEVLTGVTASLKMVGSRMQELSVDGVFETGGDLDIEMKPTTYGTRKVEATSRNAGAVLRGLDLYDNMDGGNVDFSAEIDDRLDGSPLEGRLTGDTLRIRNAPIVADVLTLGSLTGIRDTLQGEGILFTRLDAPVRVNARAIDLKDAILSGPAIGATIKGHVDRETDEIDLGGTIIPAYTVNSFLGNIPVIGELFVGREGEGVFGITYGISGKSNDPEVIVNPAAALLPGILRRIFEIGGSASDDVPTNTPAEPNVSPENSQPADVDTTAEAAPESRARGAGDDG